MRKVSDHMRLVKREAGANPARTRHRDSQATAYYHWETGKGVEASERSVGRPAFRSTGMKSYRSFMPRDSAIQFCTFRPSSLFSTASERKFPVSLIYRHIHTLLGQNFIVL